MAVTVLTSRLQWAGMAKRSGQEEWPKRSSVGMIPKESYGSGEENLKFKN